MSDRPDSSEVSVFRPFVSKLMSLQKKLDLQNHTDSFLRDRILTAVDLPAIQVAFRDRMLRTSQQAVSRISNQLSDEKNKAGSTSSCLSHAAGKRGTLLALKSVWR